jgi:ABC-2 type transport system permease protein
MTLFLHEMKRSRVSLIVWSIVLSFMLGVCIIIYPEMSSQMSEVSEVFSNMGDFSAAFGMDELNFGEFMGYFGVECGNTLGIGGAIFAALTGISALAKEEKDRTAEFLLTHPVSRTKIVFSKLLSVIAQVVILNAVIIAVTSLCIFMIGEEPEIKTLALLFLAYFLMQLEIAVITFGISAFLKGGGLGIGLGLAMMFYFMNIVSNLTEEVEFLKYITPFGYTDSSFIIKEQTLDFKYLYVGLIFFAVATIAAFWRYNKKDIS